MIDISEKNFDATIEQALLAGGSDAAPGETHTLRGPQPASGFVPGGYHKRKPESYDKALCLIRDDVLDFIYATQPKEWDKFKKQYGAEAKDRFLQRLAQQIHTRGTLEVLRSGVKANGCKFKLAYFHPASGLNEALQKLH